MSTKKQVEFEIDSRTYRIHVQLDSIYDVHGFNSLRDEVGIYTDLNSNQKIFVAWGDIPVLRFTDAPEES
jgi:hypothetical protein